jgi:hypothetical protein
MDGQLETERPVRKNTRRSAVRRNPFARLRGRPCVVVASGPSLTADDVDYCRNRAAVIVVNDNYKLAPWADVLYAADPEWWDLHQGAASFNGLRVTQDAGAARRWRLHYIESVDRQGFSLEPGRIHRGDNSGFQAVNLAVLANCSPIVLLGFDMKMGAKRHWFGDHPGALNKASPYQLFASAFNEASQRQPDLEILNATRETALECYPRVELRAVI